MAKALIVGMKIQLPGGAVVLRFVLK